MCACAAEAIRKRFKTFVEESKPVQGYYEGKGLASVISAVPPPDEVFQASGLPRRAFCAAAL